MKKVSVIVVSNSATCEVRANLARRAWEIDTGKPFESVRRSWRIRDQPGQHVAKHTDARQNNRDCPKPRPPPPSVEPGNKQTGYQPDNQPEDAVNPALRQSAEKTSPRIRPANHIVENETPDKQPERHSKQNHKTRLFGYRFHCGVECSRQRPVPPQQFAGHVCAARVALDVGQAAAEFGVGAARCAGFLCGEYHCKQSCDGDEMFVHNAGAIRTS